MTVNRKLNTIIQRLESIERTLRSSRQIISPCCQQLTDPATGDPLPVLPPRPIDVLPEVDLACARMYAHIRRKVEFWNWLVADADPAWEFAGLAGFYQMVLIGLGQWTAAYFSQAALAQLFVLLEALEERFRVADVDYCEATRQAFQEDSLLDVPSPVWDRVPPVMRPVFAAYWQVTGGLQGYENVDPAPDAPLGCCLPDTFQLLPVVRTLVCESSSYDVDVIGSASPEQIAPLVIVNRGGIPHVLRASISGFWVRSYEPPGRFGLDYWYSEAVTNDGCRYLTTPDGGMYNLSWRFVLPSGSQYIVWRNRVAYEGTYIEVSRSEPDGWNGIDTI